MMINIKKITNVKASLLKEKYEARCRIYPPFRVWIANPDDCLICSYHDLMDQISKYTDILDTIEGEIIERICDARSNYP